MSFISSVRPEPIRPLKPRISPWRREKLTPRTPGPLRSFTCRLTGPSSRARRGYCSSSRRPTIISMILSSSSSLTACSPIHLPSRSTVTRSQIWKISLRRWEM
ncbi:hypothetical protein D3C85_1116370 [compost metagenome]